MAENSFTRSFVLTPSDLNVIKGKAEKIGSLSDSAALRAILREWAEMNSKQSSETPASVSQKATE